jgi:uncharacterized protein YecT (DUF1311 family)
MKSIQLFILLFLSQFCLSQYPTEITDSLLSKLKLEVQKETEIFRQTLKKKGNLTDFDLKVGIEFDCDTFAIERLIAKRMEFDYSTSGMVQAAYAAEAEYDKLLNKYYKLLLKKLSSSDKEVLMQSQRNWIQLRDSESKLQNTLSKEEYSGGGTIQRVIIAAEYLEMTKRRVVVLFNYLEGFSE